MALNLAAKFNGQITTNPKHSQAFNVVPRNNKQLTVRYYGEAQGPGPIYLPDMNGVYTKYASNYKMVDDQTVPRE